MATSATSAGTMRGSSATDLDASLRRSRGLRDGEGDRGREAIDEERRGTARRRAPPAPRGPGDRGRVRRSVAEHDRLERSLDDGRRGGASLPLALLEVLGAVGPDAPDAQLQLVGLVRGGDRLGGQWTGDVRGEVDAGARRGQGLAQRADPLGVRARTRSRCRGSGVVSPVSTP